MPSSLSSPVPQFTDDAFPHRHRPQQELSSRHPAPARAARSRPYRRARRDGGGVGASGVGKSTLLHLLGGLDRMRLGLHSGRRHRHRRACPSTTLTAFRNRHVGFVFQFHHLLPEFTALENAEMPLRIARVTPAEARARATAVLQRLWLGDRLAHRPGMLSGGEQQRVAVARALVTEPSVLLADEPTGDLDERTAEALHALLREMHRERQLSSVIATHNMQLARVVRSRVAARRRAIWSTGVDGRMDRHGQGFGRIMRIGRLAHYRHPIFAG